jgi:hypothetical protein
VLSETPNGAPKYAVQTDWDCILRGQFLRSVDPLCSTVFATACRIEHIAKAQDET